MKNPEKYVAAMASVVALSSCCGGRVQTEPVYYNEPEAGVDAGKDAEIQEDLLTRGQLVKDMVFEVMGYSGDCGNAYFADVPKAGELCRAVEVMYDEGSVNGFPDGNFGPDRGVNKAELIKFTSEVMGYVPFFEPCLKGMKDVPESSWFVPYVGAVCGNGFNVADKDGYVHPEKAVTVPEWKSWESEMMKRLEGNLTRGETARLMSQMLLGGANSLPCTSKFNDVQSETSMCTVVNNVTDKGVMTGYQGNLAGQFGVSDAVTYSQMAKVNVLALGLDVDAQPSGCAEAPANSWYGPYMDLLCDRKLITPVWGQKAQYDLPRRDGYKLMWDSRIWRHNNP